MQQAHSLVSRIEFRTNLMRADAPVIPLGFMVECCWDDSRWLGLIYRPTLTTNELREVNTETWPELKAPEQLLRDLFDRAWAAEDGEGGLAIAAKYGPLSAFHVSSEDGAAFAADLNADRADLEDVLVARLREHFEGLLAPVCDAQVFALDFAGQRATMTKVGPHARAAA